MEGRPYDMQILSNQARKSSDGNKSLEKVSPHVQAARDRDVVDLARTGKKQVLERRFGLLSMTGFSCSLMITWEGMLVDFSLGLSNGGPAGLVYQYLFAWAGTLAVFIAMGELVSMLPTAGGQYHFVSVLAPSRARKWMSYITGWTTVISWAAAAIAVSYFTATLTQALVVLNSPGYEATRWQATLMMWAVLLLAVLVTTVFGKALPLLEVALLILHILGFFGTMIPLVYSAHGGSIRTEEVFTKFFNQGGWPSQTLAFFIGLKGNAAAFAGTDGAIHMAEEVENSAVNVARAMVLSVLINGSLGFGMLLAILYSVDDLQALNKSTSTYPIIDILATSFKSQGGATAIIGLIIFMNFAATVGALSSSGRMMWSFARDRGLPGWTFLKQVNRRTSIPVNTILVTATGAALLGLINLGSTTAFDVFLSVVLEGFYFSYLAAVSLLLYRRLRGDIGVFNQNCFLDSETGEVASTESVKPYTWGPWRVKGWLGTLNNMFAVVYLIITSFFAFWPAKSNANAQTMNYSCLILGTVMLASVSWYFLSARNHYSGPVLEVRLVTEGDSVNGAR